MECVELTKLQLQVDSLTADLGLTQELELILLLSHSQINDEVQSCYLYDSSVQKVLLYQNLVIDITGLHMTSHKYKALLSLYQFKENRRRLLIGRVPINIMRSDGKGKIEYPLRECQYDKAKILLALNVKTCKSIELSTMLKTGRNLRVRSKQNKEKDIQNVQQEHLVGRSNQNSQENLDETTTRRREQEKDNQIDEHEQKNLRIKEVIPEVLENQLILLKQINSHISEDSHRPEADQIIPQHFLCIYNQEVSLYIVPEVKKTSLKICHLFAYTNLYPESCSELDDSLTSHIEKQTDYSYKCEEDILSKGSSGVRSIQRDHLFERCKLLTQIKEKLEAECRALTEDLNLERNMKKRSEPLFMEFEMKIEQLKQCRIQIEELKEYNSQLEDELEKREKYIKEKNKVFNSCMEELNRLLEENEVLKNPNTKLSLPLSISMPNDNGANLENSMTFQFVGPLSQAKNDFSRVDASFCQSPITCDPKHHAPFFESQLLTFNPAFQVTLAQKKTKIQLQRCKSTPLIGEECESGFIGGFKKRDRSMYQELDSVYLSNAAWKERGSRGKLADNFESRKVEKPGDKLVLNNKLRVKRADNEKPK